MGNEAVLAGVGGIFVTDVSNAARTCLMDIHSRQWDPALLEQFQLSTDMLPRICSNAEIYGRIREGPLAGVPIAGAPASEVSYLWQHPQPLDEPFLRRTIVSHSILP